MKSSSMPISPNSKVYFGGWKSYQIPFQPEEPISKEEAEKRVAYYIGYFNEDLRLEQFEKYLHGQLEWRDIYRYRKNGKLESRQTIKSDGSQKLQNFDDSGRLIE